MNQATSSTSNKLNNSKVNSGKGNDSKGNDSKGNDSKGNDSKGNTSKVNESKVNNSIINSKLNNKPSTGYSGTTIAGVVILVVVLIIVLGSSYWLYNYYSKKSFATVVDVDAMPDVKNASSNVNIPSNLIPNSTYSNEYSVSCWVNILDYNYNYGKEKVILRRGDKGSANPEIVLAEKTNDLIVRIKLQTQLPKPIISDDTFIDIPITLNLDNYEETVSEGKVMFDESQAKRDNNTVPIKETFNISSYPAPVKFESNSNNNNDIINNDSDLGNNKIDYPTIKYISNHNHNFDEQYFSLISGNIINNGSKSDGNDYTRGGNHPSNETFDDVSDAKLLIDTILINIDTILDLLETANTTESTPYVASSSVFNIIIGFLSQMNNTIKAGGKNFDSITASFKTNMNNLSSNSQLSMNVDKIVDDMTSLVKYNTTVIDYNALTERMNVDPKIKIKYVSPLSASTFNANNSLIDNFIVLLQEILVMILQGMINENTLNKTILKKEAAVSCDSDHYGRYGNSNSDPTVGTCIAKMIPLQKWVNIIVSVYNQVVDIYIDGLLTSSCVLKSFPAISTSDVILTPDGGFSGYVSRVKFLNNAMTVQKAKSIYYDGPIFSESLYSQIPTWAYWAVALIIIAALGYSFMV